MLIFAIFRFSLLTSLVFIHVFMPCPLSWYMKSNMFISAGRICAIAGVAKISKVHLDKIAHLTEVYQISLIGKHKGAITLGLQNQTQRVILFYDNIPHYAVFIVKLFIHPDKSYDITYE